MESGDTKGINLISMKPFLLTIVGPFQSSNPPYFKAGFVIKLLVFFFPLSKANGVLSLDFYCCYNLFGRLRISFYVPKKKKKNPKHKKRLISIYETITQNIKTLNFVFPKKIRKKI